MLIKLNRLAVQKKGQGMTEYIIIVALIAIAAIGVVTLFGDNIRALFSASSDALTGKEQVQVKTKAWSGKDQKTLKDFADNKK
jgi:pilus assembly protein Flp/PilA